MKVVRLLYLALAMLGSPTILAAEWAQREAFPGEFGEIKENLVMAIENRGLVINYTAHIASMLNRTGADLGKAKTVYRDAEVVEFCSASLSREMMETDPHNLALCPFSVAIYTLPETPGKVWLSYRLPPLPAAEKVRALLADIVREASGR